MSKGSVKVRTDKLHILEVISLDACVRDGACAYSCPVFDDTNDPTTTPVWKCAQLKYLFNRDKGLLTLLTGSRSISKERMKHIGDNTYRCTLCGRCFEGCVLGLPTRDLWESLRSIIFDVGYSPPIVKQLSDTIRINRNPFGSEHSSRSDWIRYARLDQEMVAEKAETIYFVGCASSYKGVARRIPQAAAKILNQAGENWNILGNEEWCCGNPSIAMGDDKTTKSLAEHNVEEIEKRGARKVVFTCPGCLKTFKEYPKILNRRLNFETYHVTEMLTEYVLKEKIKLKKTDERIAYHDPCELSRIGGIIEEPRSILRELTRNYAELPESKRDARCCGGGGSYQAIDDTGRLNMGGKRIRQVKQVNPEILTSACPNCKITLMESARQEGINIKVLDLIELVASRLQVEEQLEVHG